MVCSGSTPHLPRFKSAVAAHAARRAPAVGRLPCGCARRHLPESARLQRCAPPRRGDYGRGWTSSWGRWTSSRTLSMPLYGTRLVHGLRPSAGPTTLRWWVHSLLLLCGTERPLQLAADPMWTALQSLPASSVPPGALAVTLATPPAPLLAFGALLANAAPHARRGARGSVPRGRRPALRAPRCGHVAPYLARADRARRAPLRRAPPHARRARRVTWRPRQRGRGRDDGMVEDG
jgi:hypothetical protein